MNSVNMKVGRINKLTFQAPLEESQFFLERGVRVVSSFVWLQSTAVSLLILTVFFLWRPWLLTTPPTLSILFAYALGGELIFESFRLVSQLIAGKILKSRGGSNQVKKWCALRGELPRNLFLIVCAGPLIGVIALFLAIAILGRDLRPELCLGLSVALGIGVKDVEAMLHMLHVPTSRWIKPTPQGFDILIPSVEKDLDKASTIA